MNQEEIKLCNTLNERNKILLIDIQKLTEIIRNTDDVTNTHMLVSVLESKINEFHQNLIKINNNVMKYKK